MRNNSSDECTRFMLDSEVEDTPETNRYIVRITVLLHTSGYALQRSIQLEMYPSTSGDVYIRLLTPAQGPRSPTADSYHVPALMCDLETYRPTSWPP